MINLLSLSLLVASLTAASVWSPPPHHEQSDLLIKEGGRVIVVEYEREGLRNPPDYDSRPELSHPTHEDSSFLEAKAKEAFEEAASVIRNAAAGHGGSGSYTPASPSHEHPSRHTTKEMICDVYGKCREKISSVFGGGREKASTAEEAVRDGFEKAKEAGDETVDKVKWVGDEQMEGSENAFERARRLRDEVVATTKSAGEKISENVKEGAKETFEGAKHFEEEAVENTKWVGERLSGNVIEGAKEKFEEAKHAGEEAAAKTKSAGDKMMGSLEEGAKEAFKKVKQAGDEAAEKTKRAGQKITENVEEGAKHAAQKTKSFGENVAGKVTDKAKKATEEFKEKAQEIEETGSQISHNAAKKLTGLFLRAKNRTFNAFMHAISPEAARLATSLAHLAAFSTTYGMCVWVTFVSSHVLATTLPRQQFGLVQSRIYPVYFQGLAFGLGVSWLAHLLDRRRGGFQGYNLLASLGLVLANMLYLEPRASKVMYERLKLEKEEGRGRDMADIIAEPVATAATSTDAAVPLTTPFMTTSTTMTMPGRRIIEQEAAKTRVAKLNRRLKSLNTSSSFLNVLTLMGLTWHLVYLAQRLQMSC